MTHICVGKLTIIGSDNGLSPGRRKAIMRTNAWMLLIGPLGINFSEILVRHFRSQKCTWKCRLLYSVIYCFGLKELTRSWRLRCKTAAVCIHRKTSWHRNTCRITDPLWWESTRSLVDSLHKRAGIPNVVGFFCLYQEDVKQIIGLPVIPDVMTIMWLECNAKFINVMKLGNQMS